VQRLSPHLICPQKKNDKVQVGGGYCNPTTDIVCGVTSDG